jgi:hypothetical protein
MTSISLPQRTGMWKRQTFFFAGGHIELFKIQCDFAVARTQTLHLLHFKFIDCLQQL